MSKLSDAEARIQELEDEKMNLISDAVARNSGYEQEISDLKKKVTPLLEEAGRRIPELESQRNFFGQVLVAIAFYEGQDITVVRDIAAVSLRDFLHKESDNASS